ncbi:MAG: division/cell wall cluster transcriptional repressor MraZ [Eubacteriales bacterium]|nr:division/cell wall cluster transcriptional repressor MraZ [Eubacteriales bacterium]
MFKGSYEHTMDDKGRVRVPNKFREELGESFTITRGIGQCLFVFPQKEWENFAEKLRALPLTDKKAQTFLRVLLASANDCEVDKQGRVLLPPLLRRHAQITEDVVFIGAASRVEIWSKELWDEYTAGANEEFEESLTELATFGI